MAKIHYSKQNQSIKANNNWLWISN